MSAPGARTRENVADARNKYASFWRRARGANISGKYESYEREHRLLLVLWSSAKGIVRVRADVYGGSMQGVENPPPGFEELTPREKVQYIAALWDRVVDKQDDLPLSSWQRELAHARLTARQVDTATLAWSQVRSELESKLR